MTTPSLFSSVVFAGGGSRCVWQVGFWHEVAPAMNIKPKVVAGVSAGATMAGIILAGREQFALEYMKRATAANPRNIYLRNLINHESMFPHHRIYREALLTAIDQSALERLHQGPDLRVLVARPPVGFGPRSAVFAGFFCYALEKKFRERVHPILARKAGYRAEVVSVRECHTPESVADLFLASSCTPPVLPVMYRNGGPVLDGGLVDNVPVEAVAPDPGPTLVLLTRRYPLELLPAATNRLYVQPSRPIEVYKWDYTNPKGLQDAYDLGRYDGERFVTIYRSLNRHDKAT
jgi:predicted patatin/cPLA2 family phospholipase